MGWQGAPRPRRISSLATPKDLFVSGSLRGGCALGKQDLHTSYIHRAVALVNLISGFGFSTSTIRMADAGLSPAGGGDV